MCCIGYHALFVAALSSVSIARAADADTKPEYSTEAISLLQRSADQVGKTSTGTDETKASPTAKYRKPVYEHGSVSKKHELSDDFDQAKASLLVDMSDGERKSHDNFEKLAAQMNALEVLLEHVHHQNDITLTTQKSEYDKWLQEQASDIHAVEHDNQVLTSEIEALRKSNSELRRSAEHLMRGNADLKLQLEGLSANFSIAAEFTANVSTNADAQLRNVTELAILDELDQQDVNSAKNRTREEWIKTMGTGHSVKMLQIPKTTQQAKPALEPEALMQSLLVSFGNVSQEHKASEASLKDAFEKQAQLGGYRYADLLKARAELRSNKAEEALHHERLTTALTHLERVKKELLARTSDIRRFAKHLGDQMPTART